MATRTVTKTSGLPREDVIRGAAVRLFREKGYEATTMRELAREVGIEAPSLYNHFPSKHDLLADLLVGGMHRLITDLQTALGESPSDPPTQLATAIRTYVLFHDDALEEAAITDSERRALQPAEAQRLLSLRNDLSDLFKDIIGRGRDAGAFEVDDISIATLCVLSICARIPVWYQPDGRLNLDEIADLFTSFALRALGARAATDAEEGST